MTRPSDEREDDAEDSEEESEERPKHGASALLVRDRGGCYRAEENDRGDNEYSEDFPHGGRIGSRAMGLEGEDYPYSGGGDPMTFAPSVH